jgi:hypothetical protein
VDLCAAVMLNAKNCRKNADACIDLANDLIEPEMRERLFTLAMAWLEMADEFDREAVEHEETLNALRRHLGAVAVSPTMH